MPDTFLKKITKLYPNESSSSYRSLDKEINEEVTKFCMNEVSKYIDKQKIYLNT